MIRPREVKPEKYMHAPADLHRSKRIALPLRQPEPLEIALQIATICWTWEERPHQGKAPPHELPLWGRFPKRRDTTDLHLTLAHS